MEKFRMAGEFERQQSVLLIWPLHAYATRVLNIDNISAEIVKSLLGEVDIIISSYDQAAEMRAKQCLSQHEIDFGNIQFIQYESDIVYPRDYGAEVLVGSLGSRKRVDFRFDMYGYYKEEDEISQRLRGFGKFHANYLGVKEEICANLIGEGGDHEFNGNGIMMTIKETEWNKRNPDRTFSEVEEELKRVFYLDQIIWIPQCSYDDEYSFLGAIPSEDGSYRSYRASSANGHVDEICRFTGKNTILVASVSEEEAKSSRLHALNKERLDQAYEAVTNARNQEGKPFHVLRMPVPEAIYLDITEEDDCYSLWDEEEIKMGGKLLDGTAVPVSPVNVLPAMSYCNFLIANNVVVAQKYYVEGMPEQVKEKDEQALSVLKEAFPDRKIVQINTLALNLYGGGIHCHTKNIPWVSEN